MRCTYRDELLLPSLFDWCGPVDRGRVLSLFAVQGWSFPDDLLELVIETGGGTFFESEVLLRPFGGEDDGENLVEANARLRGAGRIPDGLVVFHIGLGMSAFEQPSGRYMILRCGRLLEDVGFTSCEEWYSMWIRSEYAERYGLPSA